ncbi:MAG TPA: triple tyrosine motif-containing protein, partial [Chitinophagaceae bacterium]|nr:triple tyrosine motif-containing protein [Chitinophagaceae bacterium]
GLDKVQVINGKMLVENLNRAYNLFQYVSKISSNKKGIHWVLTSVGGINKIEPSFSLSKNFLPRISFSEIKTGKDTIVIRGKKVFLPYRENQMTFNLAAPSFINEKQTHFSYRLEGSTNSSWSEPSSNSEIRFVNLAPGDYKLHVKATFPSGLYPITTDHFHFEILPPWWQTWWFRVMLIGAAVLITILSVRTYFRRKMEKQRIIMEKQQVIELERRRIAGEMHDDLGAGLSNIRFLSEKVKRESANTGTQFDAEKLVNNSNDLAQKMNEIIWAMNEKNDTLEVLIFYTRAYAMEYCEENKIACKVTLPDSIPEKFVSGEIRRNIFLTVKESLHNVVKHSGASAVLLEFNLDKGFSVRIIDNGKGINGKSKSLYGNGLVNMQSRISMLKGTMNIRSANGVTVEFSVPLT